MIKIIIGTTPTIMYTFSKVNPADFVKVILTIMIHNKIKLEKTLTDAIVKNNTISWTLTQEETLSLGVQEGTMMMNWLTVDGTRGASEVTIVCGKNNHVKEVIS